MCEDEIVLRRRSSNRRGNGGMECMTPVERMSMARRSLADVRTCLQTDLRCTSQVLYRYPPDGSKMGRSFHENDVQMPLEKIKVHAAWLTLTPYGKLKSDEILIETSIGWEHWSLSSHVFVVDWKLSDGIDSKEVNTWCEKTAVCLETGAHNVLALGQTTRRLQRTLCRLIKLTFIGLNMKLLFLDGRAPLATDMFICNGRIWRWRRRR